MTCLLRFSYPDSFERAEAQQNTIDETNNVNETKIAIEGIRLIIE